MAPKAVAKKVAGKFAMKASQVAMKVAMKSTVLKRTKSVPSLEPALKQKKQQNQKTKKQASLKRPAAHKPSKASSGPEESGGLKEPTTDVKQELALVEVSRNDQNAIKKALKDPLVPQSVKDEWETIQALGHRQGKQERYMSFVQGWKLDPTWGHRYFQQITEIQQTRKISEKHKAVIWARMVVKLGGEMQALCVHVFCVVCLFFVFCLFSLLWFKKQNKNLKHKTNFRTHNLRGQASSTGWRYPANQ